MSNLRINNITDRIGGSGPVIAGVSTVTKTGAFTVPVGSTENRGGRGRGVFSGANPSNASINKIEINKLKWELKKEREKLGNYIYKCNLKNIYDFFW